LTPLKRGRNLVKALGRTENQGANGVEES